MGVTTGVTLVQGRPTPEGQRPSPPQEGTAQFQQERPCEAQAQELKTRWEELEHGVGQTESSETVTCPAMIHLMVRR